MSRKLFALESAEDQEVIVSDMGSEEAEMAEVQMETDAEVSEIIQDSEAISEGEAAADQLEEVQEVVEASISPESDGEGLPPVAAEAVRIAVEAIAARIGYNKKAVYQLYATENFRSASSRRANTSLALEGIGDFLKDLWKKIKEAINSLIARIKAFWDKHFSNLGRAKKALESIKAKVSESSGKFKGSSHVEEAPGYLVDAFASANDITPASIKKYIESHLASINTVQAFSEVTVKSIETSISEIEKDTSSDRPLTEKSGSVKKMLTFIKNKSKVDFGTLVGGIEYTVEFDVDMENDTFDVTVEKSVIDNKETKLGIYLADKAELSEILKKAIEVVNNSIKFNEKATKQQDSVNKAINNLEKIVNKAVQKIDESDNKSDNKAKKTVRDFLKVFNKSIVSMSVRTADVMSYQPKLAKAVGNYAKFCLKNYKAA